MNGQWTSSKTTWLRFQLWTVDGTHNQYIWVNLADIIAIKEYSLDDGTKLSLLLMRDHNNWTVLGWAGDRLKEVQESQ